MDTILKNKIKIKLTEYLKRPPTGDEIINAQTDINIMGWIRDDEQKSLSAEVKTLSNKIMVK